MTLLLIWAKLINKCYIYMSHQVSGMNCCKSFSNIYKDVTCQTVLSRLLTIRGVSTDGSSSVASGCSGMGMSLWGGLGLCCGGGPR